MIVIWGIELIYVRVEIYSAIMKSSDPAEHDFSREYDVYKLRTAIKDLQEQIRILKATNESLKEIQTPSLVDQLNALVADCGISGMKQKMSELEKQNAELKRENEQLRREKRATEGYARQIDTLNKVLADYKTVCEANKRMRKELGERTDQTGLGAQVEAVKTELAEVKKMVSARNEWRDKQPKNTQRHGQYVWGKQ